MSLGKRCAGDVMTNKWKASEFFKSIEKAMLQLSEVLSEAPNELESANKEFVNTLKAGNDPDILDHYFEYSTIVARMLLVERNINEVAGAVQRLGNYCRAENDRLQTLEIPGGLPVELYKHLVEQGTKHKFDAKKSAIM